MQSIYANRLLNFGARRLFAPLQQRTFLIKTLEDVRKEDMVKVLS